VSISLSRTYAVQKTAEWIKIFFGVLTLGDPMHIVLDGGPNPLIAKGRKVGENFANCKAQKCPTHSPDGATLLTFNAAFAKSFWRLVKKSERR